MVCPCNGMLFSNEKEHVTDKCYDMEEPQNHYAKGKPVTKGHKLYNSIYMKWPEQANLLRQKSPPITELAIDCVGLEMGAAIDCKWAFWNLGQWNLQKLDCDKNCVTLYIC